MSDIYTIDDPKLAEALRAGAVGVIPTDTVYGLVACAANEKAVAKLYALKHREHKPGTLIAANVDQLVELGLKKRYMTPVEQYWPGAISIIIPVHELAYLHQGVAGLAVRIPANTELLELLNNTGPLVTSSANDPGEPTANTVAEAKGYFGDSVDFYVDGGDMSGHLPSTIVRVVDDALEVVRPGAVKIEE